MKKELTWAIITGFGLGLIITWGIWSARRAVKPEAPETEIEEITAISPTPAPVSLNIENPQDASIVEEDKTVVSGKTDPEAVLAIFTEEEELIIEADENGKFETEIDLIEGANEITVIAFVEEGNEASQSMTIVYSTAEL